MDELKLSHYLGLALGLLVFLITFLIEDPNLSFFLVGISFLIASTPFIITIIMENKEEIEKEEMFLEFSRNLVESVKTGTPISKSIINVRGKSYGALTPHVHKLANQIAVGIPLNKALQIFSNDAHNDTISRALTLIGQAEKAGGNIGEILEAVAGAVATTEKLKKERKAAISTLVSQGYIIFIVFILIVLVMQFKILPMLSSVATSGDLGVIGGVGGEEITQTEMANAFLYLLLMQGAFGGLTIGKLAEGNIKAGIKHSFALTLISFLISAGASVFLGAT